jgi:hypothetical protein
MLGIRLLLFILGLLEEKVGSKFLVLVAGEVGLDGLIPRESQTTQLITN